MNRLPTKHEISHGQPIFSENGNRIKEEEGEGEEKEEQEKKKKQKKNKKTK